MPDLNQRLFGVNEMLYQTKLITLLKVKSVNFTLQNTHEIHPIFNSMLFIRHNTLTILANHGYCVGVAYHAEFY